MKALVLGGGGIKGCFQAGAIYELLQAGFKPSRIHAVSVGSLNGAFLAAKAAELKNQNNEPDWSKIGEELKKFWLERVDGFDKIGEAISSTETLLEVMFNNFNGLVDTAALQKLVEEVINKDDLRNSPVWFAAGCVNLSDGRFLEVDQSNPDIMEYIIASTAIPILMPISYINGSPMVDGGLRNVTPLKYAAKDEKINGIVCISCQPEQVPLVNINYKNIVSYANRLMDIITNGIVTNDLEWAEYINDYCPKDGSIVAEGPFRGYRYIPIGVIRPAKEPDIDIQNFTNKQIKELLEIGQYTARHQMKTGKFKELLSQPD
ncbi:MAG: patatin-like phospholipase family protein [Nitrospirota bacterium]